MAQDDTVWIVTGEFSRLPCAIFRTQDQAVEFIRQHSLTCTLSEYPLDESTYDHALRNDLFRPRKPHESESEFIGDFSPRMYHTHYEDGIDGTEMNLD